MTEKGAAMSPQQDPVLTSLTEVKTKVDSLAQQIVSLEKRLHIVYTVVVLVVGVIGGPNAVQLLSGGAG
jgi:hypothetical protein